MTKDELLNTCLENLNQTNTTLGEAVEKLLPAANRLDKLDDLNYQVIKILNMDIPYEKKCQVLVAYANKLALVATYNSVLELEELSVEDEAEEPQADPDTKE